MSGHAVHSPLVIAITRAVFLTFIMLLFGATLAGAQAAASETEPAGQVVEIVRGETVLDDAEYDAYLDKLRVRQVDDARAGRRLKTWRVSAET